MEGKMKKERLIILLGILVALIFFYLGLNEWLKSKQEEVPPPPLVVKPIHKQPEKPPQGQEQPAEAAPPEKPQEKREDVIAQKIREEKEKPPVPKAKSVEEKGIRRAVRTYTVQVGAFKTKENAEKALRKALSMGYKAQIVEEDDFYKVRLLVRTEDIRRELARLRSTFGGVSIKR